MNKRIKKKHKIVMVESISITGNPWNKNTPHWKRIKASGRKRKMHYRIGCIYSPNRNNRVYDYSLVQETLKKGISYE